MISILLITRVNKDWIIKLLSKDYSFIVIV